MATLPSDLSLDLVIGPVISAGEHQSNYTAIQTAVNAIIDILAGGASTQVLTSGGGSTVSWAAPGVTTVAPTHLTNGPAFTTAALTANTAYLAAIPDVTVATTITRIGFSVSTASGNMDIGVYYSDDESTFTRLFSTGSFAVPGGAGVTTLKATGTQTITPQAGRRWYFGFGVDNATATFSVTADYATGNYKKAASFPLPASLTAMTAGNNSNIPTLAALA